MQAGDSLLASLLSRNGRQSNTASPANLRLLPCEVSGAFQLLEQMPWVETGGREEVNRWGGLPPRSQPIPHRLGPPGWVTSAGRGHWPAAHMAFLFAYQKWGMGEATLWPGVTSQWGQQVAEPCLWPPCQTSTRLWAVLAHPSATFHMCAPLRCTGSSGITRATWP